MNIHTDIHMDITSIEQMSNPSSLISMGNHQRKMAGKKSSHWFPFTAEEKHDFLCTISPFQPTQNPGASPLLAPSWPSPIIIRLLFTGSCLSPRQPKIICIVWKWHHFTPMQMSRLIRFTFIQPVTGRQSLKKNKKKHLKESLFFQFSPLEGLFR